MADKTSGEGLVQQQTASTGGGHDFVKRQPLIALTGLGAALGSVSSLIKKIKRATSVRFLPKFSKKIPKYMRSPYIKYPAIFIILLASVKKYRSIMKC